MKARIILLTLEKFILELLLAFGHLTGHKYPHSLDGETEPKISWYNRARDISSMALAPAAAMAFETE